ELEVILKKVKAHSGVEQNERADRIAKEGGKVDVPTRVKRVITEDPPEAGEPKKLETILCSNKEAQKRQIHNSELYQDVLCRKYKKRRESFKHLSICPYDKEVWIKKEEEILK
ncbi:33084_t:CDS:2, partial [Gigaspora margarita]